MHDVKKNSALIVLVSLIVTGFLSCDFSLLPRVEKGSLLLTISLPIGSGSTDSHGRFIHPDTHTVTAIISAPDMTEISKTATVSAGSSTLDLEIDSIPPGENRSIAVTFTDSLGISLAEGSKSMTIIAGITNIAQITAIPTNSILVEEYSGSYNCMIPFGVIPGKTVVYRTASLAVGSYSLSSTNNSFSYAVYNAAGKSIPLIGAKPSVSFTVTTSSDYFVAVTIPVGYQGTADIVTVNFVIPSVLAFMSLIPDGSPAQQTTTELTLTFNVDPGDIPLANITVTGATKGILTGSGTTRILFISGSFTDGAVVTVKLTNFSDFIITTPELNVTVYKDTTVPESPSTPVKTSGPTSQYWNNSENTANISVNIDYESTIGDLVTLRMDGAVLDTHVLTYPEVDVHYCIFVVNSASLPTDKSYAFTATQTDAEGNVSAESPPLNITKDTISPFLTFVSATPPVMLAVGQTLNLVFDSSESNLISQGGTINGKPTSLNGSGLQYTAMYSVVSGDPQHAIGAIPVDLHFTDQAGNQGSYNMSPPGVGVGQ